MDEGEGSEVDQEKVEAEEGGLWGGGLLALEATGILARDAEPVGPTLVDSCNDFNELSRLEMIWTVRHRWPAG